MIDRNAIFEFQALYFSEKLVQKCYNRTVRDSIQLYLMVLYSRAADLPVCARRENDYPPRSATVSLSMSIGNYWQSSVYVIYYIYTYRSKRNRRRGFHAKSFFIAAVFIFFLFREGEMEKVIALKANALNKM